MKQLKTVLLLLATLTILTTGQSVAVVAMVESPTNNVIVEPDDVVIGDPLGTFDVDTNFVGHSIIDEIERSPDGSYHVVSDSGVTLVKVGLDVSGFTCFGACAFRNNTYAAVIEDVTHDQYNITVPGSDNITLGAWDDGSEITLWEEYNVTIPDHNVTQAETSISQPGWNESITVGVNEQYAFNYSLSPSLFYNRTDNQGEWNWFMKHTVAMIYSARMGERSTDELNRTQEWDGTYTNVTLDVPSYDHYTLGNATANMTAGDPWGDMTGAFSIWIELNGGLIDNNNTDWDGTATTADIWLPMGNSSYSVEVPEFTNEFAYRNVTIPVSSGVAGYTEMLPEWIEEDVMTADAYTVEENHWEDSKSDRWTTAGQLYIIIDGTVNQLTTSNIGTAVTVVMSQGTHVVSFLYIGMDGDGTMSWASDTIVIRVLKSADDFTRLGYQSSPVTFTLTDLAATTTTITTDPVIYDVDYSESLVRQITYGPTADLAYSYGGNSLVDGGRINIADPGTTMAISGTINSSGFDGYQAKGWSFDLTEDYPDIWTHDETPSYTATTGHVFLIDALGPHLASETDKITYFTSDAVEATGNIAKTFVGLLVLSEFGYYYELNYGDHACFDCPGDHDGFSGSTDGEIAFEGSFDFNPVLVGITVFDDPNFGVTSITTTTETTTGAGSTSTKTVEEPGFRALISLLALGIIAFAAPRFRRENKVRL